MSTIKTKTFRVTFIKSIFNSKIFKIITMKLLNYNLFEILIIADIINLSVKYNKHIYFYLIVSTTVGRQIINAKSSVQISDQNNVADIMILFEETAEIKHLMDLLNSLIKNIAKYFNHKQIR
jgi:hypothetical protein